ncbi:MAG: L,D-transpeptidase [Gemmatimonadota bacterium]
MYISLLKRQLKSAAIFIMLAAGAHATVVAQSPGNATSDRGAAESIADAAVYRAADAHSGMKIMVSVNERRLRLISDRDTLLSVPVAVGMGRNFEYNGKVFRFETPTGRRKVLAKSENPLWVPPEWHYMEKAAKRDLELVRLADGDTIELSDESLLVVKGTEIGRVNQFGNFWAFPPGTELIFDGRIFVPPFGTGLRSVPQALGPYKLELGDGYLIHGTHIYNAESVGSAVSHGCVRMNNSELDRLYFMVEPGTPVFIY